MDAAITILKSKAAPVQCNEPAITGDNPAYAHVVQDIVYLDALNVILTSGTDGGVDWQKAKSGASFVQSTLADAKEFFATMAFRKPPI